MDQFDLPNHSLPDNVTSDELRVIIALLLQRLNLHVARYKDGTLAMTENRK